MLAKIWNFIKSPGPMAVVAISGISFGIYGTLFYERQAAVAIELLTNNPVFDIRTDVSKLGVTYAGVDLRKASQTLRLLSVKITNTGNKDILKGDFEEGEPISLSVSKGKVVEISRFAASNEFLQKKGGVQLLAETSIRIDPVLLERGEFMILDFLVLSDLGNTPTLKAVGKIAGIKNFEVIDSAIASKSSLVSGIFHADSLLVHILRGPVYFVIFILEFIIFVFVIVLPLIAWQGAVNGVKRWFRDRSVRKKFFGRPLSNPEQVGVEYYISEGPAGLAHLYKLIDLFDSRSKLLSVQRSDISEDEISKKLSKRFPILKDEIKYLDAKGVITVKGADISIDPDFCAGINGVCRILELEPDNVKSQDAQSKFGVLIEEHNFSGVSMTRTFM